MAVQSDKQAGSAGHWSQQEVDVGCRKHGVSDASIYKWKAKFGGMDVSDAKRLRALEDALKDIYRAIDAPAAEAALTAFEAGFWGQKYPAIGMAWRRVWTEVIPFFAFPKDVRRLIYRSATDTPASCSFKSR